MAYEKRCSNCRYCDAYYTLAYCCYLRSEHGYCSVKKQVVEKNKICDSWKQRSVLYKRQPKKVVKELENALTNIAVLRQIFDEEDPLKW